MHVRRELLDDLQPRNSLEAMLVVRIADDKWITDRSEEAAGRRVAMQLRHEPLDQAARDQDAALELGEHLFWNIARPLPFNESTGRPHSGRAHHSSPGRSSDTPRSRSPSPRTNRRRLRLAAGLLEELSGNLHVHDVWLPTDAFKMVRLMGKHAIYVEEDLEVARILMSSLTLIHAQKAGPDDKPVDWASALTRMLASFEFEGQKDSVDYLSGRFSSFRDRLGQLPLARMAPASAGQARMAERDSSMASSSGSGRSARLKQIARGRRRRSA